MSCCPPDAAPYLAANHVDEGSVKEVEGVTYYNVGAGEIGLLVMPDVFGWNGGRVRALSDQFAKRGFNVFIPKLLPPLEGGTDGDGLPPDFAMSRFGAEVGPLLSGAWGPAAVVSQFLKVVDAAKADGVKRFGFIGYCYGGWIGMYLSKAMPSEELVAAACPHPSVHMEGMIGGNPVALASEVNCPWALFPCGDSAAGGDPGIYDADGALYQALEAKFPGSNLTKRYGKMVHGFTVRAKITDDDAGKEIAKSVQECMDDILSFFAQRGLCKL